MTYTERVDGRKFDELRPMEAKAGVIPINDKTRTEAKSFIFKI